ncbi:mitochondrial dicarboxylate/tricarboxylate transporter DTC-like [Arachis stenosperma]|uniref:mitochondrial dicarboxylate/tricarboxylate transporter DTC-like n=1 Tax=Arachis stenosperma TaxID=217475 RepID=UPI0025ACC59A|nr:mitochondrial dicarboxylate/tricarboxylate transporter DTC-like [Arachis stenosperma]
MEIETKINYMDPVKIALNLLCVSLLQPMDMIKVRMQLGQGSGAQIASNILKTEGGYAAFYRGLSATLVRLPLHRAVKFGSYSIIATAVTEDNDRKPLSLRQKVMITSTAVTMGWAFSIPTQLAQVRMQADATFPTSQRRNYTNVFNALHRVIADEGVQVLWRGSVAEIARQSALITGLISGYPPSFRYLKNSLGFGETTSAIGAGVISSFIGCALSLPFDYVRTQLQTMQLENRRTSYVLLRVPFLLFQICCSDDDFMVYHETASSFGCINQWKKDYNKSSLKRRLSLRWLLVNAEFMHF